jgi:error-prone DNA polymerase
VSVVGVDVNASSWDATLEPCADSAGGVAIRLGVGSVRDIGEPLAKALAAGRPFASLEDVVRRTGAGRSAMEALATAGAFGCFGLDRRRALWAAGAAADGRADRLPGTAVGVHAPALPPMGEADVVAADLWATSVSPNDHPIRFVRPRLDALGAVTIDRLPSLANGSRVLVGGVVTHRQRPATAQGTVFISLEDETELLGPVPPRCPDASGAADPGDARADGRRDQPARDPDRSARPGDRRREGSRLPLSSLRSRTGAPYSTADRRTPTVRS